jgi:carbamoyl-phosphate synthase large subunit
VSRKIARALDITGPFNIQFIAKDNEIKVIECNLRASRSFPFVSKVTKTNFIDVAVRRMLGHRRKITYNALDLDYVGVKAPQFSFTRLKEADPILSVEMASTGEVACLGDDTYEAFLKALISTGISFPKKSVLLSIGKDRNKYRLLESARSLQDMGYSIYATEDTGKFLSAHGIWSSKVYKAHEKKEPNILTMMEQKKLDLVIQIPGVWAREKMTDGYKIRRAAVDFAIPLINDINIAKLFVQAISKYSLQDLKAKSWDEYG